MHHTTWTAAQGMTLAPRSGLLQTPDGYLWYGARGALVRFDGVRFVSVDSATSPLLRTDSTGVLHPLFVDRDGVMWVSRADGAILHYDDGRFTLAFPAEAGRKQATLGGQDRAGRIWLNIDFTFYTADGGRIRRARFPASVPDTGLLSIIPDTGSGVWIGTETQGLWHVVGDRAEQIAVPPGRYRAIRPYLQSSDGRLWIWGPEYLTVTDGKQWTVIRSESGARIAPYTVTESPDHEIWVATQSDGLLRFGGGGVEHFSKRHGLADVVVRDVHVDLERNVWVLTNWSLERFRAAPFTTLGAADGVPFETPSKIVADDSGGLWIHSMSDLNLFRASRGIISGDTGAVRWSQAKLPRAGSSAPLGSLRGGGVLVWNDVEGALQVRDGAVSTIAPRSRFNAVVSRAMYQDAQGSVWVGTIARDTNLGFTRVTNGRVTPIRLEPGRRANVSAIADDGRGHLWVNNTTQRVIYKLAGDSIVARIDSSAGIHAVVTHIAVEGRDSLWVLTNRASLLRIVGRTATRVRFAGDADLLGSGWNSIALHAGRFWIASSGGIAQLELAALHASVDGRGPLPRPRVYDAADGLRNGHTPFTAVQTAAVAKDGRVWFATAGGLAVYDSRFDVPNAIPPIARIEEIVADGNRVAAGSSSIPPRPDRVQIHYTAISMRAPEKVRLEYKLEGADHDWVRATPERVATYTQLRAGHYTFRVRAWNEDGVPSSTATEMAFRVVPTWYEANLFRVPAILIAIALGPVIVFYVLRRRARLREAELHARFDAALVERNRIARELHDTLLQGFGGITLQLHTVSHTLASHPDKAAERLGRVLTLADSTLVDARHMIWDLRTPELEHQDLPEALANAARDAIVDAPIQLRFNVRGEERRLPPLVESTVLRVGREAATNAARHARPKLIEIDLAYGERHLDLHVRDDGAGFTAAAATDHRQNGRWGIAGMRERAARAGGAFMINSEAGVGTTVSLQLPIT